MAGKRRDDRPGLGPGGAPGPGGPGPRPGGGPGPPGPRGPARGGGPAAGLQVAGEAPQVALRGASHGATPAAMPTLVGKQLLTS
jgi:translation initiation factor IF-2